MRRLALILASAVVLAAAAFGLQSQLGQGRPWVEALIARRHRRHADGVPGADDPAGRQPAPARAVDPHAPRSQQATQYQRALDYWIEHVQPISEDIRAALGLPRIAPGDLRL